MSTPLLYSILRKNPETVCVRCGAYHKQVINGVKRLLTKDHIVPLAEGGEDEMKNVQILCNVCHSKKTLSDGLRYGNLGMINCGGQNAYSN